MLDGYSRVAAIVLLSTVLPEGTAAAQDDATRKVLEAVERFVAASKAKDLEAVMKAVDVPYHYGGDKIVRERQKLRAMMKVEIEAAIGMASLKHKVERIERYKDFRPSVNDKEQLKLMDEAMGKEGWIVRLRVWEQQPAPLSADGAYPLTLLVRMEDGTKVVGVYIYRGATA